MTNDIIKIKIEAKTFIESLTKQDDGSVQIDEGIVSGYLADILNAAGVEAEARYQDTDWSISIKGKKYYSSMSFYDKPEEGLISAIRYFADELNSGNDFETWYSYCRGDHFLNVKQKEPGTGTEPGTEPEPEAQ